MDDDRGGGHSYPPVTEDARNGWAGRLIRGCQITLVSVVLSAVGAVVLNTSPQVGMWVGLILWPTVAVLGSWAIWLLSSPRGDGAWLRGLRGLVRVGAVVAVIGAVGRAGVSIAIRFFGMDASLAAAILAPLSGVMQAFAVVDMRYMMRLGAFLGDRILRRFFAVAMWAAIVVCVLGCLSYSFDWERSVGGKARSLALLPPEQKPPPAGAAISVGVFVAFCLAYAWAIRRLWRRLIAVASGEAPVPVTVDLAEAGSPGPEAGSVRREGLLVWRVEDGERTIRRIRRRNKIVFGLFLLSPLGGSPFVLVFSDQGWRVVLGFFGCLAIVGAVYAIIVFLRHCRLSEKPPRLSRILGVIGMCGLVFQAFHGIRGSLIARVGPLDHAVARSGRVGLTAMFPSFGHTRPQEWVIDGSTYVINTTYWTEEWMSGIQFSVECSYGREDAKEELTDEQAMAIAFSLMKHAYETGLYANASARTLTGPQCRPSTICVLVESKVRNRPRIQYVQLSVDEIQRRLSQGQATEVGEPSTPQTASGS